MGERLPQRHGHGRAPTPGPRPRPFHTGHSHSSLSGATRAEAARTHAAKHQHSHCLQSSMFGWQGGYVSGPDALSQGRRTGEFGADRWQVDTRRVLLSLPSPPHCTARQLACCALRLLRRPPTGFLVTQRGARHAGTCGHPASLPRCSGGCGSSAVTVLCRCHFVRVPVGPGVALADGQRLSGSSLLRAARV